MLSEITELEMRTLIEFMYCGEATIDQSQLEALLKVRREGLWAVLYSVSASGGYLFSLLCFSSLSVFRVLLISELKVCLV